MSPVAEPIDHAKFFTDLGRRFLEKAMQTKPENKAAYSRWIQAHEHLLAAAKLLDLDEPEEFDMRRWALKEISHGCTEHDAPLCTLLVNKHDGRELHIPGTIESIEVKT